jgi:hypothetical protein
LEKRGDVVKVESAGVRTDEPEDYFVKIGWISESGEISIKHACLDPIEHGRGCDIATGLAPRAPTLWIQRGRGLIITSKAMVIQFPTSGGSMASVRNKLRV